MEKQKVNHLYIASCAEDGGIYHYKVVNGVPILEESLPLRYPMYMAISEGRLHCVLKHRSDAESESAVVKIELKNGYFGEISSPVGTHGHEGCHLCLLDGKTYVVNYGSGNLCLLPDKVAEHVGHGVDPVRQDLPHTHCVIPTPDRKYLCVTDLGTDEIVIYDKELNRISKADLPPGSGPRHLLFSEDGKRLYCVNELRSGVSFFSYDDGKLTYMNTRSVLPRGYDGESYAAAIRLYRGNIYVSNRGHDSIAYFKADDENGEDLLFVGTGGSFPRDFFIMGDMLFSANERSDSVTVFNMVDGNPVATNTVLSLKSPLAIEGMIL